MNIKDVLNFELKRQKYSCNKYIKVLVYFLSVMILMSFISRFSKSLTVPIIQTTNIYTQEIKNEIKVNGNLKGNKNITVSNIDGCLINDIYVSVGTKINEGDILYQINTDSLNEKINDIQKQISQKNIVLKRAYEDYNHAKNVEEQKISDAQNAMIKAEGTSEYDISKKSYEEAINNKEYNLISYKRAIEDLENDTSLQILNSTLSNYNKIIESNGNIKASCNGIVTDILISKNQISTGTSAMTITDTSSGIIFEGKIAATEGKYISNGMVATLEGSGAKLSITSTSVDSNDNTSMNIVAMFIEDIDSNINIKETASINIVLSSKKYNTCIPIESLRCDSNKYFVFIVKEEESFIGTIYKSEKVNVEIIDKDLNNVAIKDSTITNNDKIIVKSNKNIFENDEVRIDNQ